MKKISYELELTPKEYDVLDYLVNAQNGGIFQNYLKLQGKIAAPYLANIFFKLTTLKINKPYFEGFYKEYYLLELLRSGDTNKITGINLHPAFHGFKNKIYKVDGAIRVYFK